MGTVKKDWYDRRFADVMNRGWYRVWLVLYWLISAYVMISYVFFVIDPRDASVNFIFSIILLILFIITLLLTCFIKRGFKAQNKESQIDD